MNVEDYNKQALAFVSKALNIPVVMTPDTKAQGLEVERDMFERLFTAEHKARCMLEVAALEACVWLSDNAPGRAYSTLTDALEAVKQERQA
jgi:hypothetical protein